jgi:hypothetical protein
MNRLSRLAPLALLIALIPTARAQYGIQLNCDVAEHNGDCALYGISLVQLLANPEKYDGSCQVVAPAPSSPGG